MKRAAVMDLVGALDPAGSIREYVLPHYLILYARFPEHVHLLAIRHHRHHRQLAFDLGQRGPSR